MSADPPLVIAILHADEEDVHYQLYSQAYGIEMQVDDEWNAEAVLLAPYDHLAAVTEDTDVTGEDAAIVSAGVTDVPLDADGLPDLSVIADSDKNNWLLVGDPRLDDSDATVAAKRDAALAAHCRVVLCLKDTAPEHLAARLAGVADCSSLVVALVHPDATAPETAAAMARTVREQLAAAGATGQPRIVVAGDVTPENAAELVASEGVDGVLLLDDRYDEFDTILEVLEAVGD